MSLLKRMMYMGFGALLVLAVVVGGVAVFAQSGDEETASSAAQDGDQNTEEQEEEGPAPERWTWDFRGGRGDWGNDEEALGISVEELQAARAEVRAAPSPPARSVRR